MSAKADEVEVIMDHQTSLLRPMSFGTILDYTFRTYRKYFAAIFLFSLILIGVINTIYVIGQNAYGLDTINQNPLDRYLDIFQGNYSNNEFTIEPKNPAMDLSSLASMLMLSLLYGIISGFIITPFVQGGITCAGEHFLTNRDISLKWLFSTSLNKFGRLIVTGMSLFVYYIAAAMCFMIVSVIIVFPISFILAPAFIRGAGGLSVAIISLFFICMVVLLLSIIISLSSLTYSVVMFENKFHFNAIIRSFQLAGRRFWKSAGITIIVYIILFILTSAFEALTALPFISDFLSYNMLTGIVQVFIGVLVTPIIYIAFSILYFDIRIRTEGYDIESMVSTAQD